MIYVLELDYYVEMNNDSIIEENDIVDVKLTLLENPFNKNRTVYYLVNTNKFNKLRAVNDKRQDGVYVAGYRKRR